MYYSRSRFSENVLCLPIEMLIPNIDHYKSWLLNKGHDDRL